MDRAEFLNRLEAQLLDVPQAEREEALQYYEDYLNDAGDAGDFDILQELGTPEKVADSIRNGLRQESSDAGERSGQADENWQDSSRSGQAGDSGYFFRKRLRRPGAAEGRAAAGKATCVRRTF